MNTPALKSKLEELAELFANESIKFDLKPFSDGSRLVAKYRKHMNDLMKSDPYSAYMGLGVISAYESNYEIALSNFRAAESLNPYSRSAKINIASCQILNGELDAGIKTFIAGLNLLKDNKEMIHTALNTLNMFFYFDEVEELKAQFKNNTVFESVLGELTDESIEVKSFLQTTTVDVTVLRSMQLIAHQVFSKHFAVNSSFTSCYLTNKEENKIDEIIYIAPKLFNGFDLDLDAVTFEMNEVLQDALIDLSLKYSSQENNEELINSMRNISMYFAIDYRNVKN